IGCQDMHSKTTKPPTDIDRKVRLLIREQLGVDEEELTPDAHITDDLGADALDQAELSMAIEEEFQVEVTGRDSTRCQTVQDLLEFVSTALAERAPTSS